MFSFFRVLVAIIFLAVTRIGHADGLVISPRVGADIDSVERDYFQLFPSLLGFQSASFFTADDSSVVKFAWMSRTEAGEETKLLMIDRDRVDELGRFIDRYEQILAGDTAGMNFGLLYQLASVSASDGPRGAKTKLILMNGNRQRGRLLYASKTGIGLMPLKLTGETEPYKSYPATEINWLSAGGPGMGRTLPLGMAIGLVCGAGLGYLGRDEDAILGTAGPTIAGGFFGLGAGFAIGLAFAGTQDDWTVRGDAHEFRRYWSEIRKFAAVKTPPPEVVPELANEPMNEDLETPEAMEAETNTRYIHKLHITAAFFGESSAAVSDMEDAITASGYGGTVQGFLGPVDFPATFVKTHGFFSMEYDLSRRSRIGLYRFLVPRVESSGWPGPEESVSGGAYGLEFQYVMDLAHLPRDRFEFTATLGLDAGKQEFKAGYYEANENQYYAERMALGKLLRAAMNVYLNRALSVQAALYGHFTGSFSVPSHTYTSPYGSENTVSMNAHTVNPSSYAFQIGISLHPF